MARSGRMHMSYDLMLEILAAAFPLMGCMLFLVFWRLLRDDAKPDPIYDQARSKRE